MKHLTYSDVRIKPKLSSASSRRTINVSLNKRGLKTNVPLVNAPMESVVGQDFVRSAHSRIGTTYHRFGDNYKEQILELYDGEYEDVIPSIGLNDDVDWIAELFDWVLLDVAYANNTNVIRRIQEIKRAYSNLHICTGNVATYEGYRNVADAGADAIRVGISHGSGCLTAVNTGVGVPMISAIQDCYTASENYIDPPLIIADGGIKHPGDVAKAIAAGADLCMAGSIFAGTKEAPGRIMTQKDGTQVKEYWGSASKRQKGSSEYVEGGHTTVAYKGTLNETIEKFKHGLQSAFSYVGAKSIDEFKECAELIEVSSSSHHEGFIHAS